MEVQKVKVVVTLFAAGLVAETVALNVNGIIPKFVSVGICFIVGAITGFALRQK